MISKNEKVCINCVHECGIICLESKDCFSNLDERTTHTCDKFMPKMCIGFPDSEKDIISADLEERGINKYVSIYCRNGQRHIVYIGQDRTEALIRFLEICGIIDKRIRRSTND